MIKINKTFEKLKKVDTDLAEEYLYHMSKVQALQRTLWALRDILQCKPADSIIEVAKGLVERPVTIIPDPTVRVREVASPSLKAKREEAKFKLMALGINFKDKDSTKRLLKILQSVEGDPKIEEIQPSKVESPVPQFKSKQKNTLSGW